MPAKNNIALLIFILLAIILVIFFQYNLEFSEKLLEPISNIAPSAPISAIILIAAFLIFYAFKGYPANKDEIYQLILASLAALLLANYSIQIIQKQSVKNIDRMINQDLDYIIKKYIGSYKNAILDYEKDVRIESLEQLTDGRINILGLENNNTKIRDYLLYLKNADISFALIYDERLKQNRMIKKILEYVNACIKDNKIKKKIKLIIISEKTIAKDEIEAIYKGLENIEIILKYKPIGNTSKYDSIIFRHYDSLIGSILGESGEAYFVLSAFDQSGNECVGEYYLNPTKSEFVEYKGFFFSLR